MTSPLKLRFRLFYFAGIGSVAASIHLFTVFNLVHFFQISALVANIFGFLVAFNISFLGHKHLTFSQLHNQKVLKLAHFFLVALSAAVINETLYYLLLTYTRLNYLFALLLVLGVVSIYSFILSRFWACR